MYLLYSKSSSLAFSVVFSILPPACDNIVASSFDINGFFWHQWLIVPGATDIQWFLTWLHSAEEVSQVEYKCFHIYNLLCLHRATVIPAWKRESESTQADTFFWLLQCNNCALSEDFCWRLKHCLLSSEHWVRKHLKLSVQSCEWLSSFKKISADHLSTCSWYHTCRFLPLLSFLFSHILLSICFSRSEVHCPLLAILSIQSFDLVTIIGIKSNREIDGNHWQTDI